MKADQACIVIFREKKAFRRYMICLFHVLDRLGSLRLKNEMNLIELKVSDDSCACSSYICTLGYI